MKNGYDQFFKKAQKIAAHGPQASRPIERTSERKTQRTTVQSQDAKILAQELRGKLRPRLQKRARKKFPWKLAGVSFLGLLVTAAGLTYTEEIEKWTKKIEVSMIGSAYAEDTKPAAAAASDKAKDAKAEKAEEPVGKKEYTEEDISHFSKLNERKRELDAREEELARMEQELLAQKTELDKRLTELENTRRNISSVLEEKVKADDAKVDNLVQMYSNMKPQQAAKAFEEMDEGLAIEILGRMKKKNAAEIMNLVKSEKVKILSEKYAGYKRNNN